MEKYQGYSIPYSKLKDGIHIFNFVVHDDFFQALDHTSLIERGSFDIVLELNKVSNIATFLFEIKGSIPTACDRCLADISLPIQNNFVFHGKVTEKEIDDENCIAIRPDQIDLDLSHHIYEMLSLSLPLHKIYNCEQDEEKPCDMDVLLKYAKYQDTKANYRLDIKNLLPKS